MNLPAQGRIISIALLTAALSLTIAKVSRAQTNTTPAFGTFYSAKDPDMPPLPFNPHPELAVTEVEPGHYVVDDTSIPDTAEQAAAKAMRQAAAQRASLLSPAAAQAAQAASAAATEDQWQQLLDAAQPFMRSLIPEGQEASEELQAQGEAEFSALRDQAALSEADQQAKEQALDELAERLQTPREIQVEDGHKLILAGELADSPIYIGSQNSVAAAGISADELWPFGTWPYSDSNTGLNLTGTNVALSLWEVDGGARTNHMEFGARVKQRDNAALDLTGHATEVAGTMAAGGAGTFSGIFAEGRGVAYQANVSAYDIASFKSERESAAAGDATNPPVFLGNQSWGLRDGWRQQTITNQFGTVVTNAWVWWGPASASFPEDYKFGFYTPSDQFDTGCVQIDQFHQAEATRHLMVYACGNDRLEGPTNSPGTYYRPTRPFTGLGS